MSEYNFSTDTDVQKKTMQAADEWAQKPIDVPGYMDIPDMEATAESLFDSASARLKTVGEANKAFLAGQIPEDVKAVMIRNAAERSAMSGLGTGMKQFSNITARDLGLTSLQLQQQGMATEANLAASEGELGKIRETFASARDAMRQENVRLIQSLRGAGLGSAELDVRLKEIKESTKYKMLELMSSVSESRESTQMQYAVRDKGGEFQGKPAATYDSLLRKLENRFKLM